MKNETSTLFAPLDFGSQPCSYFEASPEAILSIVGGCGPGGFGDYLVPDTIWGLSIKPSCSIHDWMYRWGVTLEDKEQADRVFLNNMLRQILNGDTGRLTRWLRRRRARKYYLAVKWWGAPAYWNGKNKPEEMG